MENSYAFENILPNQESIDGRTGRYQYTPLTSLRGYKNTLRLYYRIEQ